MLCVWCEASCALVKWGADLELCNGRGKTAADLAKEILAPAALDRFSEVFKFQVQGVSGMLQKF